jgi:hypothetical protein
MPQMWRPFMARTMVEGATAVKIMAHRPGGRPNRRS